jgi:farnesyl diphosphate synthase
MSPPSVSADADTAFAALLADRAARAGRALDALLPRDPGVPGQSELAAAMRHATLVGGKRLRAFLAMEVAALFGAEPARADRVAASVECLHAYSLVHDDMPCMDDDDLRRGQPTVHRRWDEATAVLAGDALQSLAFEILADPATHPAAEVRAALCLRLARAAGSAGMVGGQAIDLAAEHAGRAWKVADVKRLQALKTGALIAHAAESGAVLGEAREDDVARIGRYAAALGEAFQIADDILDATGDEAETGKRVGKDSGAGKATFVDLLGLEGARSRASGLVDEAVAALAPYGGEAEGLRAAAAFVIARRS